MALVVVSAGVEPEQREELERRAAADDRTISYHVRRALTQYLEHEGAGTNDPPPERAVSFRGHEEETARP